MNEYEIHHDMQIKLDKFAALQVDDLTRQLQQLASKLASAQQALLNSSHKSPAKSQRFSASLGTFDAMSPSQTEAASQSTQAVKRLHADPSLAMSSLAHGHTQAADDTASQPASTLDHQTEQPSAQAGDTFALY